MKNKKWWQFWIKSDKPDNSMNMSKRENWNIVGNEGARIKFKIHVGEMDSDKAKEAISSLISSYKEVVTFDNNSNLILPNNPEDSSLEEIKVEENGSILFKKEYWFGPTNGDTPNIEYLPSQSLTNDEILEYFHFNRESKISSETTIIFYTWELLDDNTYYLTPINILDPLITHIIIPSRIKVNEFLELEKLGPGKRFDLYLEKLIQKYKKSN